MVLLARRERRPPTHTQVFLPAAGNRYGTSVNNVGSNGNYWSSSYNNSNNAYNLNFNSGNLNTNNNNRNNGFSVRLVRSCQPSSFVFSCRDGASTVSAIIFKSIMMLTREQLYEDLNQAYLDARRHKRNKPYQLRFEANLEKNLESLCEALLSRTYKPQPSDCFIITDPKKREVFAAHFRDRIVHHLYFNYTHEMFERTFIEDSYSCIKGRGTHYGIARLRQHIMKESQNYKYPCFVLKMDIRGYFMNIDRAKLLAICLKSLEKMSGHRVGKLLKTCWTDYVDMDFVRYLTNEIVMLNPTKGCRIIGPRSDWGGLPHDKSLFHSPKGCGLPIGNLTSQLFSNVYLNEFDQFMKQKLHCKHYGRYVDDFFVVSCDEDWLESLVPEITEFLSDSLGLAVHDGKTEIRSVNDGIEFLGAFVLPYRTYLSRATLQRMDEKLFALETEGRTVHEGNALNSYCGVLSHWNNYNVRRMMLLKRHQFTRWGMFDYDLRHFYD